MCLVVCVCLLFYSSLFCPFSLLFTICLVFVVCHDPGNLQKRVALGGLEHLLGDEKLDLTQQQNHPQCTQYEVLHGGLLSASLHVLCMMSALWKVFFMGYDKCNYTLTYMVYIFSVLCMYS